MGKETKRKGVIRNNPRNVFAPTGDLDPRTGKPILKWQKRQWGAAGGLGRNSGHSGGLAALAADEPAADDGTTQLTGGVVTPSAVRALLGLEELSGETEVEQAVGLARHVGLRVDVSGGEGKRWAFDGETISVAKSDDDREGSNIIHEVAHYLVAEPARRHLPNFGLGQHMWWDASISESEYDTNRRVDRDVAADEEACASAFGIMMEYTYGWVPDETLNEHGWTPDPCERHVEALEYEGELPELSCSVCWAELHEKASVGFERAVSWGQQT